MRLNSGIEFRKNLDIDMSELPDELYEGMQKKWTNTCIYYPKNLMDELCTIVEQYLRVMGLDSKIYPARVDLGFSETGRPIIYEITTGFVDQVGSCLALQELTGDETGFVTLSATNFDSSILTSQPYKGEYELMRRQFEKSGNLLGEGESDRTFVYGYPNSEMQGKTNFIPGWKGLNVEEKTAQINVLSRLGASGSYMIPRYFSRDNQSYSDLPQDTFSQLVFKQSRPKMKGERNTIVFGKGKQVEQRYLDGEMIAQEYIPAFRDPAGRRFESKVLFMPTQNGTSYAGIYLLEDNQDIPKIYSNTNIPNDGYPQGPGIITS